MTLSDSTPSIPSQQEVCELLNDIIRFNAIDPFPMYLFCLLCIIFYYYSLDCIYYLIILLNFPIQIRKLINSPHFYRLRPGFIYTVSLEKEECAYQHSQTRCPQLAICISRAHCHRQSLHCCLSSTPLSAKRLHPKQVFVFLQIMEPTRAKGFILYNKPGICR